MYFSAEDGLAETQYVFLKSNGLPDAWAGKDEFTIFETGFGTGLNFLAVWELFEQHAKRGQRLRFISVEKYPLSAANIREALEPWGFEEKIDIMLGDYPSGFAHGGVSLSLLIGDVNAVMPGLDEQVDCWFLDGFKPSSNPEMWSETVFQNMARMSKPGATFATFTSAGFVKRGLREVGFEVEKVKGFGEKRDMLVGRKI